jgi:hypothetical protein
VISLPGHCDLNISIEIPAYPQRKCQVQSVTEQGMYAVILGVVVWISRNLFILTGKERRVKTFGKGFEIVEIWGEDLRMFTKLGPECLRLRAHITCYGMEIIGIKEMFTEQGIADVHYLLTIMTV